MAALLFATHPIHTEAVTWVAGLPDLSFTFFYLLSLYFYIRSTDSSPLYRGTYPLSVASFFLATLCKEPALTLPIVLFAYDYTFRRREIRRAPPLRKYIPYLIVSGAYLTLRFRALGKFAPATAHPELSSYQYFINIIPLFAEYLAKLILPTNLNAFHVLHPISSMFEAKAVFSFGVTAAFVVLAFRLRRNMAALFGLLFIVVPLLPVLYIPGLGKSTFAERYLYASSFGFVLLVASLVSLARLKKPGAAAGLTAVLIVIAGLYSWATISRNAIWKDQYTFLTEAVRKSPDADRPHYDLGKKLGEMGKLDEAIEQYETALQLNPDYKEAHNNLGLAFADKGWVDKAIEQYQIALKLDFNVAEAHYNLGSAFFNKGWIDKAIEQWEIALRLSPDDVASRTNLGTAFLNKGWVDRAIEQYQRVLKMRPDYALARKNLAIAVQQKGSGNE